eukprot:TRINITY_DN40115_c0_g1_i1.p1 TRINITY_DN40115_c0_g1~~TRINITY_DN40115_c0_g1_i1.p1  ORF type:complete len:270 (+),score=40.82 TRINITY_DN40115_c0_g1_i1:54-863(+)
MSKEIVFTTRVCKRSDLDGSGGEYAWLPLINDVSRFSAVGTAVIDAVVKSGSPVVAGRLSSLGLDRCPFEAKLWLDSPLSWQLPDETGDTCCLIGPHLSLVASSGFDAETLSKLKALSKTGSDNDLSSKLVPTSIVYWSTLSEWDPAEAKRVPRSVSGMHSKPRFCALHTRRTDRGTEVQVGLIVAKGDVEVIDKTENLLASSKSVHLTLAAHWLLWQDCFGDVEKVCGLLTGDNALGLEREAEAGLIAAITNAIKGSTPSSVAETRQA